MKGFGLLEMIVYVSILAAVLVVVVNTLLVVGRAYGNVRSSQDLNRSFVTAMNRMTLEIRQSNGIQVSGTTFYVDPSQVTLDRAGELVSFSVLDGVLQMTEGGVTQALTPDTVQVTSFILERIVTGLGDGIKITLGLASGSGVYMQNDTMYTSVMLRGNY